MPYWIRVWKFYGNQGWCIGCRGNRINRSRENTGARLVREAASKTSDIAGDGTTTATVLTEAIFLEGLKHVTSGADPMALNRVCARLRKRW